MAAPTRGSSSRSRSCRSDDSTGTESPSPSAIPAVITPIPPALLSTPIRNPPGKGCWVSTAAVSAMSAAPRHADDAGLREQGRDADTAADGHRPATTASSGLRSANRRAVRANFSALPNDSRYSAATVTVVVLAPGGEQVVAGHVELGPQRRERVHADPLAARQVEDA